MPPSERLGSLGKLVVLSMLGQVVRRSSISKLLVSSLWTGNCRLKISSQFSVGTRSVLVETVIPGRIVSFIHSAYPISAVFYELKISSMNLLVATSLRRYQQECLRVIIEFKLGVCNGVQLIRKRRL